MQELPKVVQPESEVVQVETEKPQKQPFFSDLIFRVQKKIPEIKCDAVTLFFWVTLIEVTLGSLILWVSQIFEWGTPDVTIHWWFFKNGWTVLPNMPMFQGIGIHWSTLFFFAFGTLNLSFYLKTRLKIQGIHNAAYSLLIGFWVASMVFELPYVFFMDYFHNFGEITRFPIWLSGWNTIYLGATGQAGIEAPRWILVAELLYPTVAASGVLLLMRKYGNRLLATFGFRKTKQIMYGTFVAVLGISAVITGWFLLNVGIYPVIIRNFGWFLGIIVAYVILLDAVQNPASPSFMGDNIKISFRFDKVALVLFIGLVVGYIIWILYPITPLQSIFPAQVVKGYWFPQTVYAFYQTDAPIISNQIWVENLGIWFVNHMIVKLLATVLALWVFAPKIKVKNQSNGI